MYFVSKKLKKKYNITDERTALYEACETWVDALDGRDFLGKPISYDPLIILLFYLSLTFVVWVLMFVSIIIVIVTGGLKPNLADLAVFGVLRPIRYLTSGKDMVEHTRIGEWYARMENVVGESSRVKA